MTEELPPAELGTTVVPPPNWSATEAFQEAISAANEGTEAEKAQGAAGKKRTDAICRSLKLTLSLFEHRKGGHREEIDAYLADCGFKPNADAGDHAALLAIVKCVFKEEKNKQQRTWRINALMQALKEHRTSDDVMAYFAETPPTAAARKWRQKEVQYDYYNTMDKKLAALLGDKKEHISVRLERCSDCAAGVRIAVPKPKPASQTKVPSA